MNLIASIIGSAILTVFSPTPASVVHAQVLPLPQIIEAPAPPETLPEMIERISAVIGNSTSTLTNLVFSESGNDSEAVGDHGCSLGYTQQNTCTTNVTPTQALDAETALTIAANDIKNHIEDRYTVCNCYSYLKTRIKGLPRMDDLIPNGTPSVGAVAIFEYHDKETGAIVKHVAQIDSMTENGFTVAESNYTHCLVDQRYVAWNDTHIVGFWSARALQR